jgi:riboflavin kinase/FMN adenylyltransferase
VTSGDAQRVLRLPQDDCPAPGAGTAVTIGTYDGVHRGHRAVIAELQRQAADRGLSSAVVTFDRHPAEVIRPELVPRQLTSHEHEVELLVSTGVDKVVVLTFDEARAKEPAEEFVREVLVECLGVKLVIVGDDFHFGHERRGNVALLTSMGAELGFEVEGLDLVGADGEPAEGPDRVSSTAIRRALERGDLVAANEMLGRPHEVRGLVEHGDHRGREWGFPTANVAVPELTQLPADGIYAAWFVRPDGSVHPGAASLGRRPTIYDDQPFRLLEVHLLDGDDFDLYGEAVAVRFVARLRGEERFDDVDALIAQIGRDCEDARGVLAVS